MKLQNFFAKRNEEKERERFLGCYDHGLSFLAMVYSDGSPTKERYRYYEMLSGAPDSPYDLDWDMELEKSW